MKVIVFGATGGSGRAIVSKLHAAGHQVTAFARTQSPQLQSMDTSLHIALGDALSSDDVTAAMADQDAVIVSLGNSQNPFLMKLGARRTTAADVCERGTTHILQAMQQHGVQRLIVISAFGVGDTRDQASFLYKLFFNLVLKEHMADKEKMEPIVKQSGLDWTLVQPIALSDGPDSGRWYANTQGKLGKSMISRNDMADYIVHELQVNDAIGATVTLSGAID